MLYSRLTVKWDEGYVCALCVVKNDKREVAHTVIAIPSKQVSVERQF